MGPIANSDEFYTLLKQLSDRKWFTKPEDADLSSVLVGVRVAALEKKLSHVPQEFKSTTQRYKGRKGEKISPTITLGLKERRQIVSMLKKWKGEHTGSAVKAKEFHTYANGNTVNCKIKFSTIRELFKAHPKLAAARRRMAQREFSSRRDSPVMVRLLEEIVAAQDN